MKLRTWKYYINQGLRGIFKNGLMSFASVVIVSACIFIVILSLCIITNVDYMLNQIESEIGITLFLGEKPTQEDVDALMGQLRNMPEVSDVTFKSADEALEDAKEMYTPELLEGLKDDNPLPRSLEIKLKDIKLQKAFISKIEQLQWDFEEQLLGISSSDTPATDTAQEQQPMSQAETSSNVSTESATQNSAGLFTDIVYAAPETTAPVTEAVTQPVTTNTSAKDSEAADPAQQALSAEPTPELITQGETQAQSTADATLGDANYEYQGIELISHAQQLTETLITIDTAFKLISVVLITILGIVSIGIIMNTIKLTVFIRKNEINIMKYVGATDWFIRWPFIIEGVVIGLIGAIVPSILCVLGYYKLYNFFESDYAILKGIAQLKPAMEIFTVIIPIALIVGMLIGAIGSISSIRKHLNV